MRASLLRHVLASLALLLTNACATAAGRGTAAAPAAPALPAPVTVCEGQVAPLPPLSAEPPAVPEVVLRAHLHGWAAARCAPDAEGRLRDCELLYAPPALGRPFLDALPTQRYAPPGCPTVIVRQHFPPLEGWTSDASDPEVRAARDEAGRAETAPRERLGQELDGALPEGATPPGGVVVAHCVIAKDGSLGHCYVQENAPFADLRVLRALLTHHYEPVLYQGRPVEVDYTFNVRLGSKSQ